MIKRTFKKINNNDIENAFFNTNIFAEKHYVNNKLIPIIIDNYQVEKRTKYATQVMDGTYINQIEIYVKARNFGSLPEHGVAINIDGKQYKVINAVDEDGIYNILLQAHRGR